MNHDPNCPGVLQESRSEHLPGWCIVTRNCAVCSYSETDVGLQPIEGTVTHLPAATEDE